MKQHLSQTARSILKTQLLDRCGSMIDESGQAIANTGFLHTRMKQADIKKLLDGNLDLYRDTGKQTVNNFTIDGQSYTLKVEISWNATVDTVFSFDHRVFNPCDYLTASDLWEGGLL